MNHIRLDEKRRFGEAELSHPDFVRAVAFSADGRWILTHNGDSHNNGRLTRFGQGAQYVPPPSGVTLFRRDTYQRTFTAAGHAGTFAPDSVSFFFLTKDRTGNAGIRRVATADGTVIQNIELGALIGRSAYCLALSPDGSLLAIGGHQRIFIYDTQSGQVVNQFPAHPGGVERLAFANANHLVSAGIRNIDDALLVWDIRTGKQITALVGIKAGHWHFSLSSDGRRAIAAGEEPFSVCVWDVQTGQMIRRLGVHDTYVTATAFAPDGRHAASAAQDGSLCVWDVDGAERVVIHQFNGTFQAIPDLTYDAQGAMLAAAGPEGRIHLWSVPEYLEIPLRRGGHDGYVRSVVMPDADTIFTCGNDGAIRRADIHAGVEALWCHLPQADIHWLACAPQRGLLASGHSDGKARLWSPLHPEVVGELSGHAGGDWVVNFSDDETRLLTLDTEWTLRLWNVDDVKTARVEHAIQVYEPQEEFDDGIASIGLLPDPALVGYTGIWNSPIIVYNWEQGKVTENFAIEEIQGIRSFAASPDGNWLAAGGEAGTLVWWHWPTREMTQAVPISEHSIGSLAWSPDSRLLAVACQSEVTVWDVTEGQQIGRVEMQAGLIFSLCFAPDGRHLVAGSAFGVVVAWRLSS